VASVPPAPAGPASAPLPIHIHDGQLLAALPLYFMTLAMVALGPHLTDKFPDHSVQVGCWWQPDVLLSDIAVTVYDKGSR
jgi:hypothetical protein